MSKTDVQSVFVKVDSTPSHRHQIHKWMTPDCSDQERMGSGWREEARKCLARGFDREPLEEVTLKLKD